MGGQAGRTIKLWAAMRTMEPSPKRLCVHIVAWDCLGNGRLKRHAHPWSWSPRYFLREEEGPGSSSVIYLIR